MKFYVYELVDPDGAVFYVGKGTNDRWKHHTWSARRGSESRVHRKIRKLWSQGLEFVARKIFETDSEEDVFQKEKEQIALYGRVNLTNLTDGGEGTSGRLPSARQREMTSLATKGRKWSPEMRERLRLAHIGQTPWNKGKPGSYVPSAETLKKISASLKGKPAWNKGVIGKIFRSAETKKKMGIARRARMPKPLSEEHKRKIGLAHIGHLVSEETRRKMSVSRKGKGHFVHTAEARQKMSASRMGHVVSEETRRKIRQTLISKRIDAAPLLLVESFK